MSPAHGRTATDNEASAVSPVPLASGDVKLWADINYGGCELLLPDWPSGVCANMDENTNDQVSSFRYDPNAFKKNCIIWK
jgi:hypothetical protein